MKSRNISIISEQHKIKDRLNPHRNKLEKVGDALVIDLPVEAQGEGESQDGWRHEDEAPRVDHNCQNQHKHYSLERDHLEQEVLM